MLVTVDSLVFFFFNDTATTEIYTLSLHDALPICAGPGIVADASQVGRPVPGPHVLDVRRPAAARRGIEGPDGLSVREQHLPPGGLNRPIALCILAGRSGVDLVLH